MLTKFANYFVIFLICTVESRKLNTTFFVVLTEIQKLKRYIIANDLL